MRKWWLESVRDRPTEEARRRLAFSNAHTAIPIETVDGVRGTLVDGYNVYADPAMGDFLKDVRVQEPATSETGVTLPAYETTTEIPSR